MQVKMSRFASPEIERLLKKLEAAEENYNTNLRSVEREKRVLPIHILDSDGVARSIGYTRDISANGVGMVTPKRLENGAEMTVELKLPEEKSAGYLATCRWTEALGDSFFASGWELAAKQIDMEMIEDALAKMEWTGSPENRIKFSIPATIQQKGQLPTVEAFTGSLAGDGASLIANQEVPLNSFCKLKIVGQDGEVYEMIAKCVWSKQYSQDHWLTAWEFPRLDRVAKFHSVSFR